jgi:hypothetical protein
MLTDLLNQILGILVLIMLLMSILVALGIAGIAMLVVQMHRTQPITREVYDQLN